jgi:hypothetical protein
LKSKIQAATFVNLFGGFITDLGITVRNFWLKCNKPRNQDSAVGALARLSRAVYTGNFAHQFDGDRILELLEQFYSINGMKFQLLRLGLAMTLYVQWQDAENTGLGEIDTPGDYELHSENNLE